eukprot:1641719-Prymnesium_polylepis.1
MARRCPTPFTRSPCSRRPASSSCPARASGRRRTRGTSAPPSCRQRARWIRSSAGWPPFIRSLWPSTREGDVDVRATTMRECRGGRDERGRGLPTRVPRGSARVPHLSVHVPRLSTRVPCLSRWLAWGARPSVQGTAAWPHGGEGWCGAPWKDNRGERGVRHAEQGSSDCMNVYVHAAPTCAWPASAQEQECGSTTGHTARLFYQQCVSLTEVSQTRRSHTTGPLHMYRGVPLVPYTLVVVKPYDAGTDSNPSLEVYTLGWSHWAVTGGWHGVHQVSLPSVHRII